MNEVLTLLSVQRTTIRNNWKWASPRQRLLFLAAGWFGLLLVGGNLLFAFAIVNLPKLVAGLNVQDENLQAVVGSLDVNNIVAQVLNFFFAGAFVFLLFDAVSSALPNLYQANDLPLLLSSPTSPRTVFTAKLIAGLARPYLLLFGFGLPYLVGVGIGLHYQPLYYLFIIIALLALPLIPAGVGALLTAALVRRVSASRLSESLEVVGGLIGLALAGVIVYVGFQVNSGQAEMATNTLLNASAGANGLNWLPSGWAVTALSGAGTGDLTAALGWGLLYLVAEVGIFVLCTLAATRLFYAGWVNFGISESASRAALRRYRPTYHETDVRNVLDKVRNLNAPLLGKLRAVVSAVISKDGTELRREPTAVVQLLGPTLIGLAFVLQWRQSANLRAVNPGLQFQAFLAACLWLLFLSSFAAGLFGLNSFSREQKSIWMLKLAPVSSTRLVLAKFVLTYGLLLVFGIGFALLYGWVAGAQWWQLLGFLSVIIFAGIGAAAIAVGIGATVPRLNVPSRLISLAAGVVSLFMLLIYIFALLTCFFAYTAIVFRFGRPTALLVGGLSAAITIFLFTYVPLHLAKRRLDALEI